MTSRMTIRGRYSQRPWLDRDAPDQASSPSADLNAEPVAGRMFKLTQNSS